MNTYLEQMQQNKWRVILPIIVLAIGIVTTIYMMGSRPGAQRAERPAAQARLVQVQIVEYGNFPVVIEAYGEVVPRQEVPSKAQVTGEIVAVSDQLIPGGRIAKGDLIVQVDPRDYQLAVQRAQSALAKAAANLAREQGNQTVARQEYEYLGQDLTGAERDLVLRQPQLRSAQADVDAAQAALDDAKLDLERTRVIAPFDALVIRENVDLGTRISPNDEIALLVGTEQYWVELAVPANQLRWLDAPTNRARRPAIADEPAQNVSTVQFYNTGAWGDEGRTGTMVRVLGNLTSEGRMARVLVEIPDPLAQEEANFGKPVVLIGSYLRAEVDGRLLENVVVLDRTVVRGASNVWIMNARDELEVRPIDIVFSTKTQILVGGGLDGGERIIITDIPTAAPGMPLRVTPPEGAALAAPQGVTHAGA